MSPFKLGFLVTLLISPFILPILGLALLSWLLRNKVSEPLQARMERIWPTVSWLALLPWVVLVLLGFAIAIVPLPDSLGALGLLVWYSFPGVCFTLSMVPYFYFTFLYKPSLPIHSRLALLPRYNLFVCLNCTIAAISTSVYYLADSAVLREGALALIVVIPATFVLSFVVGVLLYRRVPAVTGVAAEVSPSARIESKSVTPPSILPARNRPSYSERLLQSANLSFGLFFSGWVCARMGICAVATNILQLGNVVATVIAFGVFGYITSAFVHRWCCGEPRPSLSFLVQLIGWGTVLELLWGIGHVIMAVSRL